MSPSCPLAGGAQHHFFLALSVRRRGSTLLYQLLLKPTTQLEHHNHRLNHLKSQTSPQPSWWNTITSTWLCLSRFNLIRVSVNALVLLWQFVFYSIFRSARTSCTTFDWFTPSLLQIIIWSGRPLANHHPEGPASCK